MYQKILETIEQEIDLENLKRTSNQINNYERSFSYRGFHKSASFCFNKFRESGISEAKKISLPSDGKTAYLDHIMPEAWEIQDASLKLVEPEVPEPILADHKKELLCVANRCARTPKNGIIAEVVTKEEMKNGADIKGRVVFIQDAHPKTIRPEVIERKGIGIISSYSEGYLDLPDGTWWINGWGGGPGWYHTKEDKKIFCFSLTPRKGNYLAELLRRGRVRVKALVKSKIYDGSIDTINALLPGQKDEEILLLAHLYEPFLNDDAIGGAALIEIARLLSNLIKDGKLSPLKRGIRFLISQERYGFAQFFQEKERREKILAAINMDAISCDYRKTGKPINVRINSASCPFFGDLLLQNMVKRALSSYPYRIERGNFSDDTFMADNTIGIPVNWLWIDPGKYHHNSSDSFDVITDWNLSKRIIALVATYAYFLASMGKKEITYLKSLLLIEAKINILEEGEGLINNIAENKIDREEAIGKLNFLSSWQKEGLISLKRLNPQEKTKDLEEEIEKTTEEEKLQCGLCRGRIYPTRGLDKPVLGSPVLNTGQESSPYRGNSYTIELTRRERIAENIIIERKGVGFPFSLVRVPFEKRRNKPEAADEALNWADGKRDLLEIFRLLNYELGEKLSENKITDLIRYFGFLDRYGYIKVHYKVKLKKEDIKKGLRKLGIKKGDKLMVHSSLLSLGYVEGGATMVCKALMETISEKGILMMPTFNHGAPFQKGGPGYYSPRETPTINGIVPDTFWRMKGVYRSLNPTHPFAAWGEKAKGYVKNHHKVTTMGEGSPLHLLEKNNGKILLLGVDYHPNTFHHTVEMTNDVPCLGKRTREYPVKLPNGKLVKLRTWSWREKSCPINDSVEYAEVMIKNGLEKRIRLGTGEAILFKMSDCRKVIEGLLKKGIKGFPCCKGCKIQPKIYPETVKSDLNI